MFELRNNTPSASNSYFHLHNKVIRYLINLCKIFKKLRFTREFTFLTLKSSKLRLVKDKQKIQLQSYYFQKALLFELFESELSACVC